MGSVIHEGLLKDDRYKVIGADIEADAEIAYLNLYGTSANSDNYYNIDYLDELIGYRPQDDATLLLERAKAAGHKVRQDETEYQGGQE